MTYHVVTHSGKFHADDVLAFALLQEFYSNDLKLTRTRDLNIIHQSNISFDVGGIYNPDEGRFDHHQQSYQGPLSSAGMVLNWLESINRIPSNVTSQLRSRIVDYVDDVDNGRVYPNPSVPCFSNIIDGYNHQCQSLEDFDLAFVDASQFAKQFIQGLVLEFNETLRAESYIKEAMKRSKEAGTNLVELHEYIKWKTGYFKNGGKDHPTEFIMFPTLQNTYQCVAIPPEENSFAQKRSFPKEWAGLVDADLAEISGVEDAIFCHKNLFLIVCKSREGIIKALNNANLSLSL